MVDKTETIAVGGRDFRLPYAGEVRPLNEREYADLRGSIDRHGVADPVLVDEDDNVIDGHHRLRIARELGLAAVPVDVRTGLTDEQKRALASELNTHRRHMTQKEREEHAAARRERVMKGIEEGKSQVTLAREEGVDRSRISRDVESRGRVAGATLPPTVTRRDGQVQKRPRRGIGERVRDLLREHPDWTDAQIGQAVEMERTNVGRIRRKMDAEAQEAREAADKAARPASAATPRGGREEIVLALLARHPDWTQAAIAGHAGVSSSYVSHIIARERARHEREAAQRRPPPSPEVRQKLQEVGIRRKWDSPMMEQALANYADPNVPQWRKDELLAGKSEPLVYTADRYLVPMRGSFMEPANPSYAPIATALDRVRLAIQGLEQYDPDMIAGLLSPEARRDWSEYRAVRLQRHLTFVDRALKGPRTEEQAR